MKGIKEDKAKKPGLLSSHVSPSSWLNIFFPIYPGSVPPGRTIPGNNQDSRTASSQKKYEAED